MNNEKAFILAVSSGDGISELFMQLGADAVIPCADADSLSADDFASAISASGADCVLLLPNGSLACEAAESAARSFGSRVCVLPSRSFAEGYAALVAMPRGESAEQLYSTGLAAISSLTPIDIRQESRDGLFGKYSAISRGERYSLAGGAEAALLEALERLLLPTHRIITLIVGMGVTNVRRVFVTERLMELYPDVQIIVYIGAQTATEYYIALR